MNDESHPKWDQVRSALRQAGAGTRPPGEDLSAPHGFATRVVARVVADARADATGLALWRRWSLYGATAAVAVLGVAHLAKPAVRPAAQFMPVPTLEELALPQAP